MFEDVCNPLNLWLSATIVYFQYHGWQISCCQHPHFLGLLCDPAGCLLLPACPRSPPALIRMMQVPPAPNAMFTVFMRGCKLQHRSSARARGRSAAPEGPAGGAGAVQQWGPCVTPSCAWQRAELGLCVLETRTNREGPQNPARHLLLSFPALLLSCFRKPRPGCQSPGPPQSPPQRHFSPVSLKVN